MTGNREKLWIRLMEKLNVSGDLYAPLPEVLRELCDYFGYGCGFIYQADHAGVFSLREFYSIHKSIHLKETFDLARELGADLTRELGEKKVVVFRRKTIEAPLHRALSALLEARSMVLIPVHNQAGELIALVGIIDRRGDSRRADEDIHFTHAVLSAVANHVKLSMYEERVETTQKSLESILDNMGIDVYVNDFYTHEILYLNKSMAAPYGGVKQMMGKLCWQALYEGKTGQCTFCPQRELIDEEGNPTKVYHWDYQRPFDGSWFRVFSGAFGWVDGRLAHVVSSVDITENKRNEEIIRRSAEYDTLTGLPNRRRLTQDCDDSIPLLEGEGAEGYLLFFDLDGFKKVNDSLGHIVGDELLSAIGTALQENPVTQDHCYRYGGDEFVLLCARFTLAEILDLADCLQGLFQRPWQLSEHAVTVNSSIGLTNYPRDGKRSAELLRGADAAMYQAKREEPGSVRFYNQGSICTREEYLALRQQESRL